MSAVSRAYIEQHAILIEEKLCSLLPVSRMAGTDSLNHAIHYSVFPGGKRMRPVLVLLGAEICGASCDAALPAACAVEFLHAASLVMDDLPGMDDAALRRGRPAVHVAFGEDIALLAGLALLNEAYAIFAALPPLLLRAVREIGVSGMVGGQAADVRGSCDRGRVEKTTALTRLTMAAGAASANAASYDTELLVAFGDALGEAYQICDDIVDSQSTDAESGKTGGQDLRHKRPNFLQQLGYRGACERVSALIEGSLRRIREHFGDGPQTAILEEFARDIVAQGLTLVKNDPSPAFTRLPVAGHLERDSLAGGRLCSGERLF